MPDLQKVENLATSLAPFLAFVPVLGQALPAALSILSLYRSTRDSIEALAPGVSGMLSDPELFDLLMKDAVALEAHAKTLIAKWSVP